jgi:HPr kinase/phosphorylase
VSEQIDLHATTVALDGKGVILTGASGSGKSAFALQLMALGCQLVADDRTLLSVEDGRLTARCPEALQGLIEARYVGILRANPIAHAHIVLAVDLNHSETERLPEHRSVTILGQFVPLVHNCAASHFPAAIVQYIRGGRSA